jgi:hypothetical protein
MSKFAAIGVNTSASRRMEIILPGEIDPMTDNTGGVDDKGKRLPGKVAYIEFLPWDSEPGRAFDRLKTTEAVRKGFRQRSRAELRAEAENEDMAADQAQRLAALAVGWYLVAPGGEPIGVEFSKENALDLFSDPATAWIRRQAWVYVGNEANFMTSSSKT